MPFSFDRLGAGQITKGNDEEAPPPPGQLPCNQDDDRLAEGTQSSTDTMFESKYDYEDQRLFRGACSTRRVVTWVGSVQKNTLLYTCSSV